MLAPLHSVIPPGGWHFTDASGGAPVRIDGDSFEDVARRVLQHRLQNGLPPGNPGAELADYICSRWPHFCSDNAPAPISPAYDTRSGLKHAHISVRVSEWMSRFFAFAQTDPGVGQRTADDRARICHGCPHNKPFDTSGCSSCIETIKRLAFVWRRNRQTDVDRYLGACQILGQHNGCAVFASRLPEVAAADSEQLPRECWRKNQ